MAPRKAQAAPTTQIHNTNGGEPSCPAKKPVVVKIMVPIMFDTTSAVALTSPSCLRREGLPAAATLLFYRAQWVSPPARISVWPVAHPESPDAKNTTAVAIS